MYAKGGPTNVDGDKDLKSLCDRGDADVRGVPTGAKRASSGIPAMRVSKN